MSTEVETVLATKVESSSDQLKAILSTLNEQSGNMKMLMNTVRGVLKDVEKQSKELEKLRNKKTRGKTERAANALPSGITKPVAISDELAKFLKVALGTLVPRNEVTKGVSTYVKENDLSDPANKQKFILDDRPAAKVLRALLGNPVEDVTYFNLQRYLKHHYVQNPDKVPGSPIDAKAVPKTKVKVTVPEAETPAPVAESSEPGVKKKIMVKKKKTELTEDA